MSWQPGYVRQRADEDDAIFAEEVAETLAAFELLDSNSGRFNFAGGTPSPSPFVTSRATAQMVPRVPIRMSPSLQSESGKRTGPAASLFAGKSTQKGGKFANSPTSAPSPPSDAADLSAAEKLDPRLARFSEIVQLILNGLIQSGGIFKGTDGYQINFSPRQITASEAFQGELFLNTTTNKISFKDNGGSTRPLE